MISEGICDTEENYFRLYFYSKICFFWWETILYRLLVCTCRN